jgi:hypothetical protein
VTHRQPERSPTAGQGGQQDASNKQTNTETTRERFPLKKKKKKKKKKRAPAIKEG